MFQNVAGVAIDSGYCVIWVHDARIITTLLLDVDRFDSQRRQMTQVCPRHTCQRKDFGFKARTVRCKSDKTNTQQFGLIADEVAKVNPDLVVRDEKGEIYTVRYEAVNAMLLNEFLKEHRRSRTRPKQN